MVYASADAIKYFAGFVGGDPPRYKELGFTSEETLNTFISTHIIPEVEGRIHQHCKKTWTADTVPAGVRILANLAGSNALVYMRVNNLGPLIQSGQFKLQVAEVPMFTDDMLKALNDFIDWPDIGKASSYATDEIKDRWQES
jgi:hypothetical protein